MLTVEAGGAPGGAADEHDPPDARTLLETVGAKQRFGDLSPAYRYALVAWLVQLLLRAIWPLRAGRTPTARNLVRAFALMAVRPIVIFLPLLVRPFALATLVGTVVASQRFEPGPPVAFLAPQIPLGILLVWVGFLLGRAAGLSRRWKLVGEAWPAADRGTVQGWAATRKQHLRYLQLSLAALVLGVTALLVLFSVDRTSVPTLFPLEVIAIAFAVAAAGEGVLGRLRRAPGADHGSHDYLHAGRRADAPCRALPGELPSAAGDRSVALRERRQWWRSRPPSPPPSCTTPGRRMRRSSGRASSWAWSPTEPSCSARSSSSCATSTRDWARWSPS